MDSFPQELHQTTHAFLPNIQELHQATHAYLPNIQELHQATHALIPNIHFVAQGNHLAFATGPWEAVTLATSLNDDSVGLGTSAVEPW